MLRRSMQGELTRRSMTRLSSRVGRLTRENCTSSVSIYVYSALSLARKREKLTRWKSDSGRDASSIEKGSSLTSIAVKS